MGDVVSFSYERMSRFGEPVNPLVTRVRDDMEWSLVLYKYHSKSPQPQSLNGIPYSLLLLLFISFFHPTNYILAVTAHVFAHGTSKPHGYWTSEKGKNIRVFFDNFAMKRQRDPARPHNWYNVTASEILALEVYT